MVSSLVVFGVAGTEERADESIEEVGVLVEVSTLLKIDDEAGAETWLMVVGTDILGLLGSEFVGNTVCAVFTDKALRGVVVLAAEAS